MLQALRNAFKLPDLRGRILFTLGILAIFRMAAHVPVPNVDRLALARLFQTNQLLGLLNMLSGGAMENFSVVAMGVYPYVTASIIMQLLTPIVPKLQELAKEGEQGRQQLNRYTYYATVPIALAQAVGQGTLLRSQGALTLWGFSGTALLPTVTTILTLTAGTMIAIWLGQLIDEKGIGNGMSIIIFGGIVASIPTNVQQLLIGDPRGLIFLAIIVTITVGGIVLVQEGQRRIPVQYGKRVRGMKVYGGQSTHIPLRVNSAGMIPIIFASSVLIFPGVLASYFVASSNAFVAGVAGSIVDVFNNQGSLYWLLYFFMVILFTYFYTDVVFRQQNLAESLQRQGGFIPGIRPGKRTEEYLNVVLQRITLVGAIALGVVAIMPWFIRPFVNVNVLLISSAGLLIVVGVVLDTMKQLEAQLLMRHYEGFIR